MEFIKCYCSLRSQQLGQNPFQITFGDGILPRHVSGFCHIHGKTPRGILRMNSNYKINNISDTYIKIVIFESSADPGLLNLLFGKIFLICKKSAAQFLIFRCFLLFFPFDCTVSVFHRLLPRYKQELHLTPRNNFSFSDRIPVCRFPDNVLS